MKNNRFVFGLPSNKDNALQYQRWYETKTT